MKTITITDEEHSLIRACLVIGASLSTLGPKTHEGMERYRELMNLKDKIEGQSGNPEMPVPPQTIYQKESKG